jgi:excisionase family DNA binding protein
MLEGDGSASMSTPLLTPQDVAERCRLSVKVVYRAISSGELRATKLRGRVRVEPADLDEWIRRNRVRAAPQQIKFPPPVAARSGLGTLQALRAIERAATT